MMKIKLGVVGCNNNKLVSQSILCPILLCCLWFFFF